MAAGGPIGPSHSIRPLSDPAFAHPKGLFTLYYCRLQKLIADNFSKSQKPALIFIIV